jgi:hypothetical protein
MRRKRFPGQPRLSRQASRLAWLAEGLNESGSRLEDAYWEALLARQLDEVLDGASDSQGDAALNQAMDYLHGQNGAAYEFLADAIEAACETRRGAEVEVLLIALPVMVGSPYHIPCGPIGDEALRGLRVQLAAHVLAEGARLALADHLFSPDQLPQGYASTRALTRQLAEALGADGDFHVDASRLPETGAFSADVRYVLGAVGLKRGAPIWRWNESDGNRAAAYEAWSAQGGEHFRALLPGSQLLPLAPDAYHAAWRAAERGMRTFSIAAAVSLLRGQFGAEAKIHASHAPFVEQRLEEYRIGFSLDGAAEIAHGVVWPLLGGEDENSDIPEQIEAALREAGVAQIHRLDESYALEYCEDCGAPLFPNPQGELMHMASAHEDEPAPRPHLH